MKVIDWSKVITNVVSAVCVMIVTSAGIIMWREATSVQDRVNEAKQIAEQNDAEIREQTEIIREIVDLIQEEMIEMKRQNNKLITALNELHPEEKTILGTTKKTPFRPLTPITIPKDNYIQQKIPDLEQRVMDTRPRQTSRR